MAWGHHLIANAGGCCKRSIRSSQEIIKFSNELVQKIDMVAYGKPWLKHFGDGNKAGFTLIQPILTSSIVAHFVEETNDIYLDVFSCKEFSQQVVESVLRSYFRPQSLSLQLIERQAPGISAQSSPPQLC